MMRLKCSTCDLEWTTKGPGHRVFYQWLTPEGRTDYTFDLIPVWAALRPPKGQYEGVDPRVCTIEYGPYPLERASSLKLWHDIYDNIVAMGPKRLFQLACSHPHHNTTVLEDDEDTGRGVPRAAD